MECVCTRVSSSMLLCLSLEGICFLAWFILSSWDLSLRGLVKAE